MASYTGPLRDEPLALELHNTRYADAGEIVDALGDPRSARAWLDAIARRLPAGGEGTDPTAGAAARSCAIRARRAARGSSRAAPGAGEPRRAQRLQPTRSASRVARWQPGAARPRARRRGRLARGRRAGRARSRRRRAADRPERDEIRACGAPGCVLVFLRGHTRREWCSAACGNRARQARHYARSRARLSELRSPARPRDRAGEQTASSSDLHARVPRDAERERERGGEEHAGDDRRPHHRGRRGVPVVDDREEQGREQRPRRASCRAAGSRSACPRPSRPRAPARRRG